MFKAPSDWNNLPATIRSITSFRMFKNAVSSYCRIHCTCPLWHLNNEKNISTFTNYQYDCCYYTIIVTNILIYNVPMNLRSFIMFFRELNFPTVSVCLVFVFCSTWWYVITLSVSGCVCCCIVVCELYCINAVRTPSKTRWSHLKGLFLNK